MAFGARLETAMGSLGPLCVGIDPHQGTLESWGLADTPDGLRTFSMTMLEASLGLAAAIKPNAAFFERHGSQGVAVLEEVLGLARDKGVLTVLDAKRGDIGSTMLGYAQSCLVKGAPLEADSLTVSPFLGFGSLQPAVDLALDQGKGLFVLALTSNPEGASVQHAVGEDGVPVARAIAQAAGAINAQSATLGSIGLVVGATVADAVAMLGIDLAAVNGPLLSPGVGAQGAGKRELEHVFGSARPSVLVNQSRGISAAGPDVEQLRGAIHDAAREAADALAIVEAQTVPSEDHSRR